MIISRVITLKKVFAAKACLKRVVNAVHVILAACPYRHAAR